MARGFNTSCQSFQYGSVPDNLPDADAFDNTTKSNIKQRTASLRSHLKEGWESKKRWFRVMALLLPYWFKLLIGLIAAACVGLVYPIYSVFYAKGINSFYDEDPHKIRTDASWYGLLIGFVGIYTFITTFAQKALMEWAGQRLVRELRALTFESMLYQDMKFFDHPNHSTGTLSQVLSADTLLIKGWSGDNLGIFVTNGATVIAAVAIAFAVNVKLAAVALTALFSCTFAVALESKFHSSESSDEARGGQVLSEAINNIKIVNAYNLQQRMLDRYSVALDEAYRKGLRNAFTCGVFYGISQSVQLFGDAFLHWYGSKLFLDGELKDVGDLILPIQVMVLAAFGIGQTAVYATDLSKAKHAARRVLGLIDTRSHIDPRSPDGQCLQSEDVKDAITIQSVNFRYPQRPDTPIFKNITFSVEPGQTVALVGGSGCGKSTIIQLLERFYDLHPDSYDGRFTTKVEVEIDNDHHHKLITSEGSVSVDGIDVRDINIKSLRQTLGLVGQEPILFNTTIADNIRYGKPDATDEEIIDAAKKSNAHDFIMSFPDGYNTTVGKFGGQLSGGQKQRIAIARTIIRNPQVLLLDEATSALDSESEKIVQSALDQLVSESKRTTIVIAHRLSTIQNADKIIVLANPNKEGSIVVESGTHQELMKLPKGEYRKLVNAAAGHTH